MDSLKLGIVVPAFFYVPYWAAQERGFYREAGLDVEITSFGGIDAVTKALKAGALDVGIGSPEHVIHDVETGGQLRMVGGNVNRLTHDLIAQPEIKRLEDLRGKVIGVSAFSGGTSSLFIEILKGAGLNYPGDYTIVEAGVVPSRHDKLMRREIDAGMQTDPHNYIAVDAGLSNLGAVSGWLPYFQFTSVNVRLDWAKAHADRLVRFLAVSIQGSQWMAQNEEDAVALAQCRMEVEERYARRAWHDHIDGDALPLDLHLNAQSIGTAMDMIRKDRSASFRIAGQSTPDRYIDITFLREAQRRAGVPERTLAGPGGATARSLAQRMPKKGSAMPAGSRSVLSRRQGLALLAAAGGAVAPGRTARAQNSAVCPGLSGFTDDPSTFWELFRPAGADGKPTVVMVPGGAHTGACYLCTADGRPGWAQHFLAAGYPVMVVDWPGIGRSGYVPAESLTGEMVCAGLGKAIATLEGEVVVLTHSMSGPYGWKLVEQLGDRIGKLVAIAPGPPGNIQLLADVISERAGTIQIRGTTSYALSRKEAFVSTKGFVEGKLIGASEQFPREYANRYAASLIPIPPRLLLQRLNVDGSQLRIDDTGNYRGKRILLVVGERDVDHSREFDQKTADWLAGMGAKVDYWYLADKGQHGNGHMMMLERNSDAIAQLIQSWIASA